MHFSLSTVATLAAALTFASQGSAFVVDVFSNRDCSGGVREVNVWDNTCANWMGGFKSYRVKAYGGSHQLAQWFLAGDCGNLVRAWHGPWVDGGDGGFKIGQCHDFNDEVINAIASYSHSG